MGTYDGADVRKLIGIFMFSLLNKRINKNRIGLYRNHSLAILKNTSSPEEKRKKKNEKLLQGKDIDIIVQCTF